MKNIKMKKIVCVAMLAIMPLLLLTSCGSETFYQKIRTNKTSTSFLNYISNDMEVFSEHITSNIAAAKLDENYGFDISDLTRDTSSAEATLNNKILNPIQRINTESLFATCIYQMNHEDLKQGYFDMSFLVDKNVKLSLSEQNQLSNFFIQTESKDENQVIYKYQLTGKESVKLNLPVQVANISTYVDEVDNAIKEWGNDLLFVVTKNSSSSTEIKVKTNFTLPDQNTVSESLIQNGITNCQFEVESNKVILYYTINSQNYIKVIESVLINSTYQKKVTQYEGDTITAEGLQGSYIYSFAESNLNLLGKYKVRYDSLHSFIYCYADHQNAYVTAVEYYKTASGELLGRFFIRQTKDNERKVVDVIVNGNLETGSIKYDYQKGTTRYTTLADEQYLTDSFTKITNNDKTLAKSKMLKEVEILNYVISENSIVLERANVIMG